MRISDWSSDVCSSDLLDRSLQCGCRASRGMTIPSICLRLLLTAQQHRRTTASMRLIDELAANRLYYHRPLATLPDILLITRSEEHTSELQSLMRTSYAAFCLKKKNNTLIIHKKSRQQKSTY